MCQNNMKTECLNDQLGWRKSMVEVERKSVKILEVLVRDNVKFTVTVEGHGATYLGASDFEALAAFIKLSRDTLIPKM